MVNRVQNPVTPAEPGVIPHRLRLLYKIDAGWLVAGLLTLFIIQSLLRPGLPTSAADAAIHLYRTVEYSRAWASGVIVPRWAPNLAYGYGYPLFVFAPPLPYILGMLLHISGLTFEAALKTLIILTIPLYAIGMYLFVRNLLHSVEAGLVAGVAYAFAPFAIRESLLYGGNVPQLMAIGLFPWTLWAMSRSARAWRWTAAAALFYTAVLLSHLFQVLIFTPVVAGYGLLLWLVDMPEQGSPARRITAGYAWLRPLLAAPLGMLLAAFFWIPAFIERAYTRAQAGIYLQKSPFFVRYPHWTELVAWIEPLDTRAANPYVPLTLGVVTLILAGLGLAAAVRLWAGSGRRLAAAIFFFAAVAGASIFMTLPASRPVWETVAILQVSEFPWRMLGLANLGLAVLAGAAVRLLPQKIRRPAAVGCVFLQILAVAPLLYPVAGFTRYGNPTLASQIEYERRSQSIGTTTLGEYLPQTVTQPPATSPMVETYLSNRLPDRLDRASLPNAAQAILQEQTAVTHRYRLNSPTPFTLRFFQFYYPGWQARLNGKPVDIRPQANTGLILIDIPAGRHTLTLRFGDTPVRLAALGLSGLTAAGLLAAGLWRLRRPAAGGRGSNLPRLPLTSAVVLAVSGLIVAAAFWLKPALRPRFTISSPPDVVLPAQHHANIAFDNGIRLVGYSLSQTVVPPGGYLQVVLYWQTNAAPLRVNLQPFVHLDRLNDFTTVAGATNYTPGDVTTESNLPTFHWDNTRYIRDEHDLYLPDGLPPTAYALRVGLIDPDQNNRLVPLAEGNGDTAQLATVNVAPRRPPPPPEHPLNVAFSGAGDTLYLTGFEPARRQADRLNFTLVWRTERPVQKDYTVFAQLLDLHQNRVAGFDGPPVGGAYPTSTWLSGQTILDPRAIPLPNNLPPGEYRLIVGLYTPNTGRRLVTANGADFFELTRITVD